MALHLVKLCVGCDGVEALARRRPPGGPPWRLHTRQTPRRADELVDGGSLYWVFRGAILCRQRLLAVESRPAEAEGARPGCALLLHPELVKVEPQGRRPFQGWRYLPPEAAPRDLDGSAGEDLPVELAQKLREIGAW